MQKGAPMTKVVFMGGDKDGETMLVLPEIVRTGYINIPVPRNPPHISFVADDGQPSTGMTVETYNLVCYAPKDNLAVFQLSGIVEHLDCQTVQVRAMYSPRYENDLDFRQAFAEGMTNAVMKSFGDM